MEKAWTPTLSDASNLDSILQAKLQEGASALRRSESVLRRMNSLLERADVGER